ncbi:MAG: hypothetical protein IT285_00030, partial [Bdellovibrionales bacterium]|nr:hypothetical protein [Bdellovibrionales bacterium]
PTMAELMAWFPAEPAPERDGDGIEDEPPPPDPGAVLSASLAYDQWAADASRGSTAGIPSASSLGTLVRDAMHEHAYGTTGSARVRAVVRPDGSVTALSVSGAQGANALLADQVLPAIRSELSNRSLGALGGHYRGGAVVEIDVRSGMYLPSGRPADRPVTGGIAPSPFGISVYLGFDSSDWFERPRCDVRTQVHARPLGF